MPSCFAHYHFGCRCLSSLPPELRGLLLRHRRLFDAGLQGPDFLFYYRPLSKTPLSQLAYTFHYQSGAEFFSSRCQSRPHPSEPELAYLYGLLGHYCLDSLCHPFIHTHTDEGPVSHNRLESELERHLLTQAGISNPQGYRRSAHLALNRKELSQAAVWFPELSPAQLREALATMGLVLGLLRCRNHLHRRLAEAVLARLGGQSPGLLMKSRPDPACASLIGPLETLFERSLARYPALLAELQAHMSQGTALGENFAAIFG